MLKLFVCIELFYEIVFSGAVSFDRWKHLNQGQATQYKYPPLPFGIHGALKDAIPRRVFKLPLIPRLLICVLPRPRPKPRPYFNHTSKYLELL